MALTNVGIATRFIRGTNTLVTEAQLAQLDVIVPGVCAAVENYCKRKLETNTYTQYLSGNGQPKLPLRYRPVTSVTSVHLDAGGLFGKGDDAFPASSQLTEGTEYVLQYDPTGNATSKSGLLIRLGGGIAGTPLSAFWPWEYRRGSLTARYPPCWPEGLGNIKVVYEAGYGIDPVAAGGTLPEDLTLAANQVVALVLRNARYGGMIQGESMGQYSYNLAPYITQALNDIPELGSARQILSRYREHVL